MSGVLISAEGEYLAWGHQDSFEAEIAAGAQFRLGPAPQPAQVWDKAQLGFRDRNAAELLEAARMAKLESLKSLREAIEFDAFPFDYEGTTHWIQSDETSLNRMDAIQIAIVSGDLSVFPVGWRTAANEWLMIADATAYSALMEGRRDHPRKTWRAFTIHEQALKTHADPASYDIASGEWPVTRIDKSAF